MDTEHGMNLAPQQILKMIAAGEINASKGFQLIKGIQCKSPDTCGTGNSHKESSSVTTMYYLSQWEKSAKPLETFPDEPVLVFDVNNTWPGVLGDRLNPVILVKPGKKFQDRGKHQYEVNPEKQGDYVQLIAVLKDKNLLPGYILHLWSYGVEIPDESALSLGIYSVFYLVKAYSTLKIKLFHRFLFIYNHRQNCEVVPFMESVSGYCRSLAFVYPDLVFSTVQISLSPVDVDFLRGIIAAELDVTGDRREDPPPHEVLYKEGTRYIKRVKPLDMKSGEGTTPQLQPGGVYLITGGCGGLGRIFARSLAGKYHARLVLVGRSGIDPQKQEYLEELTNLGAEASYLQADIADTPAVEEILKHIHQKWGKLNGIIHAAGILDTNQVMKKEINQFKETLRPKVRGTIVLDRVTKDEKLDFFVMFSSAAAVLGDFGQCDYAAANRFMDAWAQQREIRKQENQRYGQTIVINWPLWKSGGMHTSQESETLYLKSSGMIYLEEKAGIKAFENILRSGWQQVMVLAGDRERIQRFLSIPPSPPKETLTADRLRRDIKNIVSDLIKIDPQRLDPGENLGNYGFDSIMLKDFAKRLGTTFQVEISPTLFFQRSTLGSISEYLLEEFSEQVKGYYTREQEPAVRKKEMQPRQRVLGKGEKEDIAIIGMSGIFPGSRDLEEFWQNLLSGKDLVTEVPQGRWDWQEFSSQMADGQAPGSLQWGGFIPEVDKFDASFFNISPREAELMDPQQRLLMETLWKTFEDAGYRVSDFSTRSVGIFIGVESGDYLQLLRQKGISGPQVGTGNHHAMLANRMSFMFNFRGASETMNTACSSSAAAINRALGALRAGECELAVAGGINLMLSPYNMIGASLMGILSPDGRCKTFDKRANGYVKGEGVGAILLKPLSKADADHDHIYACIKGAAINHGGKANSLTAPNSDAQAELLVSAYKKAGLDPETITYIEAHGTGTELGDPVEINGLKQAFNQLINQKETPLHRRYYCGLGTVKTNIGHLEAASGIAGIIKVLLAMKHKTLPGILHFQQLNPYINLDKTPFYVVDKTRNWERLQDNKGEPIPRRAGISSFGFGGTNIHLVVEEHEKPQTPKSPRQPQIIVLSAKNEQQLKQYALNLVHLLEHTPNHDLENENQQKIQTDLLKITARILDVPPGDIDITADITDSGFEPVHLWELLRQINQEYHLDITPGIFPAYSSLSALAGYLCREYAGNRSALVDTHPPSPGLANIAYTLQVGREPMNHRIAMVVSSIGHLKEKLHRYCRGESGIEDFYQGKLTPRQEKNELLGEGEEVQEFVGTLIKKGKPDKIARMWISGIEIDWKLIHPAGTARRISLPTYPFARQRYWIPESDDFLPSLNLSGRPGSSPVFMKDQPLEQPAVIYYRGEWEKSAPGEKRQEPGKEMLTPLLVFVSNPQLQDALLKQREKKIPLILVKSGSHYQEYEDGIYEINPEQPADYQELIRSLVKQDRVPGKIVHLWSWSAGQVKDKPGGIEGQEKQGVYSLLFLSQALMKREQEFKGNIQLLYIYPGEVLAQEKPCSGSGFNLDAAYAVNAAVNGFIKTLRLENPSFLFKTLELSDSQGVPLQIPRLWEVVLKEFTAANHEVEVRYEGENRYIKRLKELTPHGYPGIGRTFNESLPLKEKGVYLITGGLGGLGCIVAAYLAQQVKARLILAGRSDLTPGKETQIQELTSAGAEVIYIKVNVSRRQEVEHLLKEAKKRFKHINGIIHCAGVIRDAFVLKKTREEMEAVLAPKIYGTLNLDEVFYREKLDFFITFSSLSAVMGNVGQCDYAYANCFMDIFMQMRNRRPGEQKSQQYGRSVSINWPLWQEGGMKLSPQDQAILSEQTGLEPLPPKQGIKTLEFVLQAAVNNNQSQYIVAYGSPSRIKSIFEQPVSLPGEPAAPVAELPGPTLAPEELFNKTGKYLKNLLGEILKLPVGKIDPQVRFQEYGIDSIVINMFNAAIEKELEKVPKTLLFEYQTLQELTGYFVNNHKAELVRFFQLEPCHTSKDSKPIAPRAIKSFDQTFSKVWPPAGPPEAGEDIAIIGLSGRYPLARNLEEYWDNLKKGKDCITEIPASRWDYRDYYEPGMEKAKMYCKWGGFLENIDRFDPLIFNISPREAEMIDPQERIFLETTWSTLEDAGYAREEINRYIKGDKGTDVGVFVGSTTYSYYLFGPKGDLERVLSYPWSIANRVSFVFDFQGPSMPVDTACSSSLTAIHLACESLKKGECHMAIAGGVNLYLHPSKYLSMCAMRMLSPTGRCHSFGDGGDGFVPGEGVGAVLLKPLSTALRDHDHIYAVVKGSAVNHGGRTNGYTVPNPNAQTSLILQALKNARINPRTISYIEAHGTGTSLGDPVEIQGLSKAYREYTRDKQFCPIGSAKSNIGHLESAAGIAGLTKIILQMKHRQLVPSLHARTLNPNIDFQISPFYVQQELSQWKSRDIKIDGKENQYPLRAGISSFGAGGANAHVILEEVPQPVIGRSSLVIGETREQKRSGHMDSLPGQGPQLIIISAKNEERLKEYARGLNEFLENINENQGNISLRDMAYTLQVGREAMNQRTAMVVFSIKELKKKLLQYCHGENDIEELYSGNIKTDKKMSKRFFKGKTGEAFIRKLINDRDLTRTAQLWISGIEIDWHLLYPDKIPNRVSLPTYPFVKNRYWVMEKVVRNLQPMETHLIKLHPLITSNVSTLKEQKFVTLLTGNEFYLNDHIAAGQKVFPGAATMEMARAAGAIAGDRTVKRIKNIVWLSPIIVDKEQKKIYIHLYPGKEGVNYQITSETNQRKSIHSQGKLIFENKNIPGSQMDEQDNVPVIDIENIKKRSTKKIESKAFYELFHSIGFIYGPGFQGVKECWANEKEVLSMIRLPHVVKDNFNDFVLHPSLMDAAFQSLIGLARSIQSNTPYLPFELGEVEILKPLTENCYSYVTYIKDGKGSGSLGKRCNIMILNERGQPLIKMKKFTSRAYQKIGGYPLLYFKTDWEKSEIPGKIKPQQFSGLSGEVLLFDTDENLIAAIRERLAPNEELKIVLVKPGKKYKEVGNRHYEINPRNQKDYQQLIRALENKNFFPTHIIHSWLKDGFSMDKEKLDIQLSRGIYSLFFLTPVLMEQKIKDKVKLLYLYLNKENGVQPQYAGVIAFSRSIRSENSKFVYKTIEIKNQSMIQEPGILLQEFRMEDDAVEIRYENHQRYIKVFKYLSLKEEHLKQLPLKENGVYLITGGTGGLGLIFSEYLARKVKAKLVLTTRSGLTPEKRAKIKLIESCGSEVLVVKADVSQQDDVKKLISDAKSRFKKIDGIIHGAGVIQDTYIQDKTKEQIQEVLAPKVYGTVYLDETTSDENLDFFVMFSSCAAYFGNPGQCDYAFGNRFMDEYTVFRESLRVNKKRQGKTISINWPLWKEGGMQADQQTVIMMKNIMGMVPLSTNNGIEAFEHILRAEILQVIVAEGDRQKIKQKLKMETETRANQQRVIPDAAAGFETKGDFIVEIQEDLVKIVSAILNIHQEEIDLDEDLGTYGFDSISFTEFANRINTKYKLEITPAIFFEYPRISSFTRFLSDKYKDNLAGYFSKISAVPGDEKHEPYGDETLLAGDCDEDKPVHHRFESLEMGDIQRYEYEHDESPISISNEPIAIIGMSGVMPQSEELDIFWKHLELGNDMICQFPKERWHWKTSFEGQDKVIWGGFLKEVDKFDAEFFGISPREARVMDPQQRICLEIVWKVIEDAGYKTSDLSGTKTGLFIGVSTTDYGEILLLSANVGDPHISTGMSHSMLVNRISYFFNFNGPSEPVDTACSSSLIAIHRAVEAIRTGTCEMAIAGGVNILLSPRTFLSFKSAGMLSEDGRCKTFDERADGYGRGEGAGVILLKPLGCAAADNDHIYAVVKGTAENHGGRAQSLTAPNTNAQAQVLIEAYERARVDPANVGYIEAHGTGTSLGDPVEINALKKAFQELYRQRGKSMPGKSLCGIGSVKTNIGHLEAAAGIASVIKVLLAMKYKKLPASINFKTLNPYIDLTGTPFYIVKETRSWDCYKDDQNQPIPRSAGISSFGYGGSNAHIVLEEYQHIDTKSKYPSLSQDQVPQIIVLSAKNEDRLKACARQMIDFLEKIDPSLPEPQSPGQSSNEMIHNDLLKIASGILSVGQQEIDPGESLRNYGFDTVNLTRFANRLDETYTPEVTIKTFSEYSTIDELARYLCEEESAPVAADYYSSQAISLANIAYTLQVGREAMEERIAMKVSSIKALWEKLHRYCQTSTGITDFYRGNINTGKPGTGIPAPDETARDELIKHAIEQGDYNKIAQLFVSGIEIDWQLLYSTGKPNRISLPTYPFERVRYWVDIDAVPTDPNQESKPKTLRSTEKESVMKDQDMFTQKPGLKLKKKIINQKEYSAGQEGTVNPGKQKLLLKKTTSMSYSQKVPQFSNAVNQYNQPVQEETGTGFKPVALVSDTSLRTRLKEILAKVLFMDPAKINENKTFIELGLDSILAVEFTNNLKEAFQLDLKATKLYDHSTVVQLARYISSLEVKAGKPGLSSSPGEGIVSVQLTPPTSSPSLPSFSREPHQSPGKFSADVAVIGMSARFPGAENIDQYWDNLAKGVDSVTQVPSDRWDVEKYYDPSPNTPPGKTYCKWGGFLKDVDKFDPLFFNISPAEAESLDPQQRLFLQEAWRTLEDAGYSAESLNSLNCGLYVGVMSEGDYPAFSMFNARSILAARLSYFLNLKGPAVSIDTACSSSAVAMHLACQSLRENETEMVLAGGVTLYLTEKPFIGMSQMGGIISREGKCKTFDNNADGFVPGEGVAVVVLKLLEKAIADGDHIYGVIKGSGINQDGKTNGITAPSAESQKNLELKVYKNFDINPETISYVEAHGTGTKLGDPIEVEALTATFRQYTDKKQFCPIGSVKTNLGHTSAASGAAGVIKVLLSMKHKKIPPSLHFHQENEHINFKDSPFFVNTKLSDWNKPAAFPRRAAISSFGYSGTNAHIIIEEPSHQEQRVSEDSGPFYFIPVSARNDDILEKKFQDLLNWLDRESEVFSLGDIAYTLSAGRSHFNLRAGIVVKDLQELKYTLMMLEQGKTPGNYCINKINKAAAPEERIPPEKGITLLKQLKTGSQLPAAEYKNKLTALAHLYIRGYNPDWTFFYKGRRYQRISMPTYPFARERYWLPAYYDSQEVGPQVEKTGQLSVREERKPGRKPWSSQLNETGIKKHLENDLIELIKEILKVKAKDIDPDGSMLEYGFDSISFTEYMKRINHTYDIEFTVESFFDLGQPTVRMLSEYLYDQFRDQVTRYFSAGLAGAEAVEDRETGEEVATWAGPGEPIAIIGVSCLMPRSDHPEAFWKNLAEGKNLFTRFPQERWQQLKISEELTEVGPWQGGFLDQVDAFDAAFFDISSREAGMMDPQQRIFLELVWKAIEDAGYKASDLAGTRTGVFVGVSYSHYDSLVKGVKGVMDGKRSGVFALNVTSLVANQVSYYLNLHGPSEAIDTASSSSLAALHRAVEALRNGTCSMAAAGGVHVILNPDYFHYHDHECDEHQGIFAIQANEYAPGEGAGVVLLKPLKKAIAHQDHIYAVIKGTAENHAVRNKSLLIPVNSALADLFIEAHENSQIDPGTISYIEAHDITGDRDNDIPEEINALKTAFALSGRGDNVKSHTPGTGNTGKPYCGIGSVKTNIGDLEASAGIAGLIKVVLAMEHKKLPVTYSEKEMKPRVNLQGPPFYIVPETMPWKCLQDEAHREIPRRAGVSSFGSGGTNVYVVLEESPGSKEEETADTSHYSNPYLVILSAKNEERLKAYAAGLKDFLETNSIQRVETPVTTTGTGNLRQKIENDILHISNITLNISHRGYEPSGINAFIRRINETFNLEITEEMFNQRSSIGAFIKYLARNYNEQFRNYYNREQAPGFSTRFIHNLANIAYTLQTGREAMAERLAAMVSTVPQLIEKLDAYCQGKIDMEDFYTGNINKARGQSLLLMEGEEKEAFLRSIIKNRKLAKLGYCWVMGVEIDWKLLYPEERPKRISLPTYPFERKEYWLSPKNQQEKQTNEKNP